MKREITNGIRYILDELTPPILRRNKYIMYPLFYIWYKGKNVSKLMNFKRDIHKLTETEYIEYYKNYDSIASGRTDLNEKSLHFILTHLLENKNSKIIDIGCGNGYLLSYLKEKGFTELTGCDIINEIDDPSIPFIKGNIEHLPLLDKEYDIVICNNTLEHIINVDKAVRELKRVTKSKLIITMPCQNYNYFTFDLHINFFPNEFYVQRMLDIEKNKCVLSDGDWSFIGYLD